MKKPVAKPMTKSPKPVAKPLKKDSKTKTAKNKFIDLTPEAERGEPTRKMLKELGYAKGGMVKKGCKKK